MDLLEILPVIFQSPGQGILCVGRDGAILFCNQTLSRMFGYAPDELLGAPVEILLPDALREAHARRREDYSTTPAVRPMGAGVELSGRRKDGTGFPVEVSLSGAQTSHGPVVVAFVADIGARKDLERRLAQSRKMEALGLLSAGLAHDFNNLLTIILGYLDESATRLDERDPLREPADAALKASHQAAQLVGQLFAFAHQPAISRQPIDINRVLRDQADLLRRVAGGDVKVGMELDPDACEALVDREGLERAVVNLVANAREATPPGGWILIETRRVEIDHAVDPASPARQNRPYALLSVSDSGRGMTPEVQEKIFEPFFTTKGRGQGAGLGLALVYAAVKRSGGEIRVHSEPGKGTSFKLYFPRPATTVGAAGRATPPPGSDKVILVVDDQRPVREMCATMLRMLGYKAMVAGSGEEALAVSRSHSGPIAVLLTDVLMPGMNGRELAAALLAERPAMRVVYMSGYTAGSIERQQLADANAGFLSKPFTLDELEEVVKARGARAQRG